MRRKYKIQKVIVLFLFLVWLVAPVLAQENSEIRFAHISNEDGLSQNSVRTILQDSQGFMWFGTWGGLNRYDGYNFKVYKTDKTDSNSLSNNVVSFIHEDSSGMLWIGTVGGGLNKFDPATEKFTRYLHNPEDDQSISHNILVSIEEDDEGILWIGAWEGGLNKFDPATEKFTRYKNNPADPTSLSGDYVTGVYEDTHGIFWILTRENGISRFDKDTGQFTKQELTLDGSSGTWGETLISEDSEGNVWFGSASILSKFSRETNSFTQYPLDTSGTIKSLLHDSMGNLWVTVTGEGGGLYKLGNNNRFIKYQHSFFSHSLSTNFAIAVYEDREGVIWVGTDSGGLNKFHSAGSNFIHYQNNPEDPDSLDNNGVYAISGGRLGTLWVGTSRGIDRLDRRTNIFTHYRHDPQDLTSLSEDARWYALYEDSSGIVWAGGWIHGEGAGLNKLDTKTGKFIHYRHDPENINSLSNDMVFDIFEDSEGVLWIGTDKGLNKYDSEKDEFEQYFHDLDNIGTGDDNVLAIIEDREGYLWLGSWYGGLDRFDKKTGEFKTYKYDSKNLESLSENAVYAVYEDSRNIIWAGTSAGLDKFDRSADVFTHYSENEGLSGAVRGILEDEEGNLWLSTNQGLFKFNPLTETFRNYDVKDGVQGNEFNEKSSFKNSEGEMFFGGTNGFNSFYPEDIKDNPYRPPIILTNFYLFNEPVLVGEDSVLTTAIWDTDELTLNYKQKIFSFEFAGLSYCNPEKNKYRYMLEGLEDEWNEVDASRRFVTYTSLPAGDYIFKVIGSNNDGVWNEEGLELKVSVLPPWWATWWFRIFLIVLIVLIVVGIYLLRTKSIRSRNIQLESEAGKRKRLMAELEVRAQKLERFAKVAVGREKRMIELKKQIRELG